MRQVEKKKEKDKIAIVLMLCFCVVALTSIFTIKSNIDKISDNQKNVVVSEGTATEEGKTKDSKKSDTDSKNVAEEASAKVPTVVSEGANNPSSGSITNVYTDDGYGLTIEITHDKGYISKYSNLSTDKMVEKGDVVTAGQTISGVGRTGLFESMEPAHLHLELLKSSKYIDPSKFIKY